MTLIIASCVFYLIANLIVSDSQDNFVDCYNNYSILANGMLSKLFSYRLSAYCSFM